MAKAYWIATSRSIRNPVAVAAYAKIAGPAISAAGGRNLVRGTPAKTFEAGLDLRTVVIEFDSVESASAAYNSAAYQVATLEAGAASPIFLRSEIDVWARSFAWRPSALSSSLAGTPWDGGSN